MGATLDLVTDLLRADADPNAPPLEPSYTSGPSDALGDRVICFTVHGATSFELLRFKPDWADAPGFEQAIRSSVEAIGLLDPSLAPVRAVERIEEMEGLTLVSMRQSGKRLSELMPRARGTAWALELVREIGPALTLLHRAGHAHGALTPDRIVVSREGRLVVIEHVLGAGLGALALPAARLRSLCGIAVPEGVDVPKIDQRLDVLQVGFIALSLIAGERLAPWDYPRRVVPLLDRFALEDPAAARHFRPWLERALQIGDRPFASAPEALAAFQQLPKWPSETAVQALPPQPGPAEPANVPAVAAPEPRPASRPITTSDAAPRPRSPQAVGPTPNRDAEPEATRAVRATVEPPPATPTDYRRGLAVLGLFVVVQAAMIGYLSIDNGPVATPVTSERSSAPEPQGAPAMKGAVRNPSAGPGLSDRDLLPGSAASSPVPVAGMFDTADAGQGSLAVVSPIELQIFEGDVRLGSTSEPVDVSPGFHAFDLVNEELGFRAQHIVTVLPGETTSLQVAVPDGRVDIEATPWADVWIDGIAVGRTPLLGVSVPIGRHEVVLRHAELGERRELVTIKSHGVARVTVVFQ